MVGGVPGSRRVMVSLSRTVVGQGPCLILQSALCVLLQLFLGWGDGHHRAGCMAGTFRAGEEGSSLDADRDDMKQSFWFVCLVQRTFGA